MKVRPARSRPLVAALFGGILALVLAGCRVAVATEVIVGADGSGQVAVTIELDEDLAGSLALDEVDVLAPLDELPDGWTSERSEPDGGLAVTLTASFETPAGLAARVAQLQDGLDDDDPLVVERLDLAVDDDGSATLEGRAGLRVPGSTALRGAGVTFDGDALAALLAARGDEVLRVDLRVTFPGPVVDSDADDVEGNVATWNLPVTEMRDVRAVSRAPDEWRSWLVVAAVGLVGLALGLVLARVRRRR